MRRILKASALLGTSSILTVLMAALRYKFIALELGADGIGLLGFLLTALALTTTCFGAGLTSSGIRYISIAKSVEHSDYNQVASTLIRTSIILASLGMAITIIIGLLLKDSVIFDVNVRNFYIPFAVALFASIVSGGQIALLNGLGRLKDIAKANVFGAVGGTIATVVSVTLSGSAGLIAALIAAPLLTLVFTSIFTRETYTPTSLSILERWNVARPMLKLGIAFSASIILSNVAQLLVRLILQHRLGIKSSGYFQAAWTIASLYLGFVLNAMAAEYFPRISAIESDKVLLNSQVNKQIQIALILSTPVILFLMLYSPILINLLYSKDFFASVDLLRWQLIGDILKVSSWAIGFVFLAKESKRIFFSLELLWNIVFIGSIYILINQLGLVAAGISYLVAYMIYFTFALLAVYHATRFILDYRAVIFSSVAIFIAFLFHFSANKGITWLIIDTIIAILFLPFGVYIFGWWRDLNIGRYLARLRVLLSGAK